MTTYTRDELKSERDKLQDSIAKLEKEKVKALEQKRITVQQFREINGEQLALENELNLLNIKLITKEIDSITVGDDSPAAKLKASTDNLIEAIDKLDDVRNFLRAAADLIDSVNGIIAAIASVVI